MGQKIGLSKEYLLEMVDPESNEPWSHGSFLKYNQNPHCHTVLHFLTKAFHTAPLTLQLLHSWSHYLRNLQRPHSECARYFMYTMGGGATPCCPEHADHSILTVSLCSEVPELAVLDKLTGEWVMVEEDADELDIIVFPGYYLSFLTCGYVHAPLHRYSPLHNPHSHKPSAI